MANIYLGSNRVLHEVNSRLQNFPALSCDKLGKRPCKKARVGKAQASIHAVGSQLQSLLPDVHLSPLGGVGLLLEGILHAPAAVHQTLNDLCSTQFVGKPMHLLLAILDLDNEERICMFWLDTH